MNKSKTILNVNPKDITVLSAISGCNVTRNKVIHRSYPYQQSSNNLLSIKGDWDLTNRLYKPKVQSDYERYLRGEPKGYLHWKTLMDSMKTGYNQNKDSRYVEVGMARDGKILLVDGRHRLFLAQLFNVSEIPVDLIYYHSSYDFENLSLIKNKLIPKFLYDLIIEKYPKQYTVYHGYSFITERFTKTTKYLNVLKDLDVLEIGCNTSLFSWSLLPVVKSYVGLEKNIGHYQQAKITLDCLKSRSNSSSQVYNMSLQQFCNTQELQCNGLFNAYVLYHLTNSEIALLKEKILPKCKAIVTVIRTKERRSRCNDYYLNRKENVIKFFEEAGFKVQICHLAEHYFILTGTK